MDAARHWAGDGVEVDDSYKDLEAMGAPPEVIAKAKAQARKADFEVWDENWDILELFLSAQTQWKFTAMGDPMGFDYACLEAMLRILAPGEIKDRFKELQIMERAALEFFAEQAKARDKKAVK